uniref:Uncharacterized protein n=1 Tax=Romanomermis culicivorax TaxID=13658 RepID=A0A915JG28_ROMCU
MHDHNKDSPCMVDDGETKINQHGATCTKQRCGLVQELVNQFVVLYNATLITKYDTHLNLEYVGTQNSMDYCLKYIMKGHDMAYIRVQGSTEVDYDKIAHAFKSHRVVRQWINGPQGTVIIFHEGYEREAQSDPTGAKKRSMTQAYFDVCTQSPLAKTLTYDELGKYF